MLCEHFSWCHNSQRHMSSAMQLCAILFVAGKVLAYMSPISIALLCAYPRPAMLCMPAHCLHLQSPLAVHRPALVCVDGATCDAPRPLGTPLAIMECPARGSLTRSALATGMVIAFTVPKIYEMHKDKIDEQIVKARDQTVKGYERAKGEMNKVVDKSPALQNARARLSSATKKKA